VDTVVRLEEKPLLIEKGTFFMKGKKKQIKIFAPVFEEKTGFNI